MATLVLGTVGSVVGGLVGGPMGAVFGRALGALAGSTVDAQLFGGSGGPKEGPRLSQMPALGASEGDPIPRAYGRVRVGGTLIWATRFEEVASVKRAKSGGKGLGPKPQSTKTYSYFANFAVALCEGEIAFVRRVWADGAPLDLSGVTMRVHRGSEAQEPDPLIVAKEGAANAPAYRGTAYAVLERLPLEAHGNRIPQLAFEVVRPVGRLPRAVRAVNLIPGAGEFAYETTPVSRWAEGRNETVNGHAEGLGAGADVCASLDQLQALCPALEHVQVVVAWFGDDLRASECRIEPRVETADASTRPLEWAAAGLGRGTARLVTRVDGRPAYGGTPTDASVVALLRELRSRGLKATLYPFVMMDVPADNALPNPWTGETGQPAYPWRGRITCHPAPGRPVSVDATAAAGAQVAAFFGSAASSDFPIADGAVAYSGPPEWRYRRFILHMAALGAAAGGVEAFIVGSEMVGLTRVRSAPGDYPAVAALAALAADAKLLLGSGTKLTYAADWTEYGAHVLDGGAELRFPLDPLWASPAIDAVGVDFYPPLGDWRDGTANADAALARSAADPALTRANLRGGEAFDFFYAAEDDRAAGRRTPITDGAFGEPWVFRPKDLAGWWLNPHHERVNGARLTTPTAWVPGSKPVWLAELGAPAVDRGPNRPSVFPDPKSIENGLPPFSRGNRDDLVQARALHAFLAAFDPTSPDFRTDANPLGPAGRMVPPERVALWAWDARPYPFFPRLADVWADGSAWRTGHWLNGRLEGAPLDEVAAALLADGGRPAAAPPLDGFVDGFAIERPMSGRAALDALLAPFGAELAFRRDEVAGADRVVRVDRALHEDELVPDREGALVERVRAQAGELPREIALVVTDPDADFARAVVSSRRVGAVEGRDVRLDVPLVLDRAAAQALADGLLRDAWAGREGAAVRLAPDRFDLEPGDVVTIPGEARPYRIRRATRGEHLSLDLRAVEPGDLPASGRAAPQPVPSRERRAGAPFAVVLDLATTGLGAESTLTEPVLQHLAVFADPWPGLVQIERSVDGVGFEPHAVAEAPATIGRLLAPLRPGPLWRFDDAAALDVAWSGAPPAGEGDLSALAARTAVAVEGEGGWEIVAFSRAELIAPGRSRLTRLLRGLGGQEELARREVGTGARVVVLDGALVPLARDAADLGVEWRVRLVPRRRDGGHPDAVTFAARATGVALRPLAPVRPVARRMAEGVVVSVLRRTRLGGDAWEGLDVPLGEDTERFECDVLDEGGAVRRTLAGPAAGLVYAAADEIADFGAPQGSLRVRVAQLSARVGRGAALDARIAVNA